MPNPQLGSLMNGLGGLGGGVGGGQNVANRCRLIVHLTECFRRRFFARVLPGDLLPQDVASKACGTSSRRDFALQHCPACKRSPVVVMLKTSLLRSRGVIGAAIGGAGGGLGPRQAGGSLGGILGGGMAGAGMAGFQQQQQAQQAQQQQQQQRGVGLGQGLGGGGGGGQQQPGQGMGQGLGGIQRGLGALSCSLSIDMWSCYGRRKTLRECIYLNQAQR